MKKFSYSLKDLVVKQAAIEDASPIGSQLLQAVGYSVKDNVLLYQLLDERGMEEISLEESIDFDKGDNFIILEGDRSFKFKIDGFSYEWPESHITLKQLQSLTNITNKSFFQSNSEHADLQITNDTVVVLSKSGIEDIYTRPLKQTYELNVNGTIIKVDSSQIVASKALALAGILDANNYQLFLKIKDEPKKEIMPNTVIDLLKPGIEKLRLIPKEVNNGEVSLYHFDLLAHDFDYLNQVFGGYRTIIDNGRRWLIIDSYDVPQGYNHRQVSMAVEIPITYPQAQLDMFYVYPQLQLLDGKAPACTESTQPIENKSYQRWSRHRGQVSQWNPATDCVNTHFALIEESLLREVQ